MERAQNWALKSFEVQHYVGELCPRKVMCAEQQDTSSSISKSRALYRREVYSPIPILVKNYYLGQQFSNLSASRALTILNKVLRSLTDAYVVFFWDYKQRS